MRNTLRFDFPEVDARRAAAEAAQRRRDERAQSLAQERYHRLLQEWERQADEARGVLAQFKEALALLEVPEQDAAADGGVEWEDVGTEEAQGAIRTSGADGLAAYAAEVEPSIPSELARTGTHASVNSGDMDVVIETVDGLYKLVCTNLLPRTQEALRTIVSAEAGVPGQPAYAQRERLLRAATELKTELTSAKEGYEASQLHLRALAAAQARRQGDVPGGDLEPAGPSGSRPEQPAELGEHNPYHFIKDPAAPQKNTLQRRMLKAPSTAKPRARPPGDAATSSLPASVRATLAARAPVLPAGAFVRVWDSSAPPMYVSNHGMEVANHWGPVDVHQELPQERIDELFLYAASDRVPQATGHAANNSQATSTSRVANRNRHNEAGTSGVTLQGRELGLLGGVMFETGRAQRAAERAYNDAIIAGATADERLAQDMQQAEMGGDGSGRANGKKRGPKRIPVKERLRKRLLTGRAMAVAQNDLAAMERDRLQEKSNNRWENK